MPDRAKFPIGEPEGSFNQDHFSCVVPFARMPQELQRVADNKCQPGRDFPRLAQEDDRKDERDRKSERVKEPVRGISVALGIVLQKAPNHGLTFLSDGIKRLSRQTFEWSSATVVEVRYSNTAAG